MSELEIAIEALKEIEELAIVGDCDCEFIQVKAAEALIEIKRKMALGL